MGGGRQDGAWEHNNQLSWQAEASGLYLASSRPASLPLGRGFLPSREAGADPQKPPTPPGGREGRGSPARQPLGLIAVGLALR